MDNVLSRIASASDDASPVYSPDIIDTGGPRMNTYVAGPVDASTAQPILNLAGDTSATAPVVIAQQSAPAAQAASGLQGAWYSVRNFFQYTIPGLFTSASTTVRGWVGSPTTVTTVDLKTGASTTSTASSSWLVVVFLIGAAAAVYYAVKGKKGKSFLPKLGRKGSVNLRK